MNKKTLISKFISTQNLKTSNSQINKSPNFVKSFWFGVFINLYCILAIFLPISGLFSNFINNSLLLLWKEILVSIIFGVLIFTIWKQRNLIHRYLQFFFLSFCVLIILIIFNSIFIQSLPLKAVVLGFRFELWWLFLFILTYFLTIIIQKEFEKSQIKSHKNMLDLDFLQNSSENNLKPQNLDHNSDFQKNLSKLFLSPLILISDFIKTCTKINPKQKLHFSIYLGFSLLIAIYSTSLIIGQTTLLTLFGFQNNSSQVSPQICHTVDFGQDSCRLSLGFGSPNHLAGYLLLVLPVFWSDFFGIYD